MSQHRFIVTLEAPSGDTRDRAMRRLRALLKAALRLFGLKCVRIEYPDGGQGE